MRISTAQLFDLGVDAITRRQAELARTQQEISAGRRLLAPSDDPVAASRIVAVEASQARNARHGANIATAQDSLRISEGALSRITGLLQDARARVVEGGSGVLADSDRRSIAAEVRSALDELIGLANSQDGEGGYLFAGYKGDVVPFVATTGGATYNGDEGERTVEVAPSRSLAIADDGRTLFERIPAGNGTFTVEAAAANAGTGRVSAGSVVDASLVTGFTYAIQFDVGPGGTTYDVVDVTHGTTLSSGNAYASGSPITFAGMQVPVEGAPADGDTFTVAAAGSQSVFTTLSRIADALSRPTGDDASRTRLANDLASGLGNLDQALEHVLSVWSGVGARLRELDALQSGLGDQAIRYEERLSGLRDLDYNRALSDFARQQIALEAAQKSFAQVTQLSLFDYL